MHTVGAYVDISLSYHWYVIAEAMLIDKKICATAPTTTSTTSTSAVSNTTPSSTSNWTSVDPIVVPYVDEPASVALIGGVVGGGIVALIALVIAAVVCLVRRQKKRNKVPVVSDGALFMWAYLTLVSQAYVSSSINELTTAPWSNDDGAAPVVKSPYVAVPQMSHYNNVDAVGSSDYAAAFVDEKELDKMNNDTTSARH